jgi:acetyl esterase/lipase
MTRLAIRFMVLFKMQPIQPREGGIREKPGFVGTSLALLNELGPGGRVAHPLMAAEAVSKKAHKQDTKHTRHDRVWFDPPPLEYYRGILTLKTTETGLEKVTDCDTYKGPAMIDMKWAKVRTRAFWFMPDGTKQHLPEKVKGAQKGPVILYFHGGAGVTFSAADIFMGVTLAGNLARSSKIPVFSVDYYLAPFAPYPVPIIQALGAYLHLTKELGYRPDQIIVGGDSFGAHLTLGLERFLRLEGPKIDPESQSSYFAAILLISPWMSAVHAHYLSRPNNLKYDIITLGFADWGIDAMQVGPKYEKRCGLSLVDPWLSPINRREEEIKTMAPMYVVNGQLEALIDEGVEFVEKARSAGADVTHHIEVSRNRRLREEMEADIHCFSCSHSLFMTLSHFQQLYQKVEGCLEGLVIGHERSSIPVPTVFKDVAAFCSATMQCIENHSDSYACMRNANNNDDDVQ